MLRGKVFRRFSEAFSGPFVFLASLVVHDQWRIRCRTTKGTNVTKRRGKSRDLTQTAQPYAKERGCGRTHGCVRTVAGGSQYHSPAADLRGVGFTQVGDDYLHRIRWNRVGGHAQGARDVDADDVAVGVDQRPAALVGENRRVVR